LPGAGLAHPSLTRAMGSAKLAPNGCGMEKSKTQSVEGEQWENNAI